MLFEQCRCPKCLSKGYAPSYDDTIDAFMKNEYENSANLVIASPEPPRFPDYLMFRCDHCKHLERKTRQECLEMITEGWAKVAWQISQIEARKALNFENYFTKYILDKSLHKFVSQRDIDTNPLIRDYVRSVENEEAKRIKKSNN